MATYMYPEIKTEETSFVAEGTDDDDIFMVMGDISTITSVQQPVSNTIITGGNNNKIIVGGTMQANSLSFTTTPGNVFNLNGESNSVYITGGMKSSMATNLIDETSPADYLSGEFIIGSMHSENYGRNELRLRSGDYFFRIGEIHAETTGFNLIQNTPGPEDHQYSQIDF